MSMFHSKILVYADGQVIQLDVICIGILEVYVDGYNQSPYEAMSLQGQMIYSYVLKNNSANLIGIRCFNNNGTGAIIARTDTGLISTSSWKVAVGITDSDWTTACYDDSQWLYSVNINNPTWPQLPDATWITYPGGNPSNSWIYYRTLISK